MNGSAPVRRRGRLIVLAMACCAMTSGGCATNDAAPRGAEELSAAPAAPPIEPAEAPATWPFWPTSMRLHPLTRLTTDNETDEPIIEARIEFRDEGDVPSRGVGRLRVLLLDAGPGGDATSSTPYTAWDVDLTNVERNIGLYDDVTHTYLLRLRPARGELPESGVLVVIYEGADDRRLEARARLQR